MRPVKMARLLRLLLGAATVAHATSASVSGRSVAATVIAAAQCPSTTLDYASSAATVEKWALQTPALAEFVPVLRAQRIDGLTLGSVSVEGLATATKLPLGVAVHLKLCFEHALERGDEAGHDGDGEASRAPEPPRASAPETQPPVVTGRRQTQGAVQCDMVTMSDTMARVDQNCCTQRHRRALQAGGGMAPCSAIPDACDDGCAAIFTPFYQACGERLGVAFGLDESLTAGLDGLYSKCLASKPPAPAHVVVDAADAARQFAEAEAAPAAAVVAVASQVSFAADISLIPDGSPEREQFESDFKSTMSSALGDGTLSLASSRLFAGSAAADPDL